MTKLPPEVKRRLLAFIDSSGFRAIGVVADLNGTSEKLRDPSGGYEDGDFIVIEIITDKIKAARNNYKEIGSEGGLAAINCSAFIVAFLVVVSSTGSSPFTGGTSLALTTVSYAATSATGVSCVNSLVRTWNALNDTRQNKIYDDWPAYQTAVQVLDGIALLGVGASAAASVKILNILKRAGVSFRTVARGRIARQGRARLTMEIARANRPGVSNRELKRLIRDGEIPRRLSNPVIVDDMVRALKESIAAGLSFLASALDGNIKSMTVSIVKLEN